MKARGQRSQGGRADGGDLPKSKRGRDLMRVHLVAGIAAGAVLEDACRLHGLSGEVLAIDDFPEVGPLVSDAARTKWWKPIRDQYLDGLSSELPGLHEQWDFALRYVRDHASDIVIWSSDSSKDQIHLRLAVAKLENFKRCVRFVHVPMRNGLAGVALLHPDVLAECGANSIVLDRATRVALACDYRDRWAESDGVRVQTDRGLELRDYSAFDEAIFNACPFEFEDPATVTGLAMAEGDGRNWMPDMFLRWRLRLLIEAGVVQSMGTRWCVDDCDIRVGRPNVLLWRYLLPSDRRLDVRYARQGGGRRTRAVSR